MAESLVDQTIMQELGSARQGAVYPLQFEPALGSAPFVFQGKRNTIGTGPEGPLADRPGRPCRPASREGPGGVAAGDGSPRSATDRDMPGSAHGSVMWLVTYNFLRTLTAE